MLEPDGYVTFYFTEPMYDHRTDTMENVVVWFFKEIDNWQQPSTHMHFDKDYIVRGKDGIHAIYPREKVRQVLVKMNRPQYVAYAEAQKREQEDLN